MGNKICLPKSKPKEDQNESEKDYKEQILKLHDSMRLAQK